MTKSAPHKTSRMIPSPIQSLINSRFQVPSCKFKVKSFAPSTLNLRLGTWNSFEYSPDAPEVFFGVHADCGGSRFDDADAGAAFEKAELFERLGAFERRLGPARVF